jgi:hypothetical protein
MPIDALQGHAQTFGKFEEAVELCSRRDRSRRVVGAFYGNVE